MLNTTQCFSHVHGMNRHWYYRPNSFQNRNDKSKIGNKCQITPTTNQKTIEAHLEIEYTFVSFMSTFMIICLKMWHMLIYFHFHMNDNSKKINLSRHQPPIFNTCYFPSPLALHRNRSHRPTADGHLIFRHVFYFFFLFFTNQNVNNMPFNSYRRWSACFREH